MNTLHVSEQFYSIQGEGLHIGHPAIFLRLTGCNLTCAGWGSGCDTEAVWRKGKKLTYEEILSLWENFRWENCKSIVVTGGEPFLQQTRLHEFQKFLESEGTPFSKVPWEFETNCTILPLYSFKESTTFNCSPKLSSAGNGEKAFNREALEYFATFSREGVAQFKFVIGFSTLAQDLREVEEMIDTFGIARESVSLMPEGSSRAGQIKNSADIVKICLERGYNFSPRLHIFIWDQATGV